MIGTYAINAHTDKVVGKIIGEEADYWLVVDSGGNQKKIPKNIAIIQEHVADKASANPEDQSNDTIDAARQLPGNSGTTILTKNGKEVKIANGYAWPLLGVAIISSLLNWIFGMLAFSIFCFIKKRFRDGFLALVGIFVLNLIHEYWFPTNKTGARYRSAFLSFSYAIISLIYGFYWNRQTANKLRKEGWTEKGRTYD